MDTSLSDHTAVRVPDASLVARHRLVNDRLRPLAFYLAVVFLIVFGWSQRHLELVTSDQGLGYFLGIAGGSMMILLLVYPARKRLRFMKSWGPVRYWFRTHMLFGILGPTLILFHCNFSLGSMNSNVALMCMIIVALSGLIGRYIYARIHHGIYGSKTSLDELRSDSNKLKELLEQELTIFPQILAVISKTEIPVLKVRTSLTLHFLVHPYIRMLIWLSRIRLHMMIKRACNNIGHRTLPADSAAHGSLQALAKEYTDSYLSCMKRLSEYTLYERLFSIWHIVHMPLFMILVITGIVHVIAVHAY